MDILTENNQLQEWLIHYGSVAIFFLMTVGIIALPVPEETLMVLAGVLMNQGKLNIPHTILAAYLGSLCGITASYFLGRTAGVYVINKYGGWFGIGAKHQDKAHSWFERFGKWTLFMGYFIPGIRHFTGLTAGITALSYKEFALYAYTGAVIWVSIFLAIGFFLGPYWLTLFENVEINLENLFIGLAFIVALYMIYRIYSKAKTL